MRSTGSFFLSLILFSLLWVAVAPLGCAKHADFLEMREELALTQKRQDTLQQRLMALEPKPGEQPAGAGETLKQVQRATSQIEALTSRIQELESRLARVETGQQGAALNPDLLPSPTLRESRVSGRSVTTPEQEFSLSSSPAITPTSAFNLAYNDYLNGRYDLAITGFQRFLDDFPSTSLAPNAHYWIGESYYSLKDYVRAIKAFEKVVSDYPRSEKVAPSLFKLGLASAETGNSTRARTYLKRIIEEFSTSDEAKLAKLKLAEIR